MEVIYKTEKGRLVHGDNIEAMKKIKENSVDSCISDFPYAIEFMGKNWDSAKHWHNGEGKHGTFEGTGYTGKKRPAFYLNSNEDKMLFYNWCYERAIELHRIIKPGGYVCIFGHPKTNHRMKCAFEDAGFNIVEEIDWVYGTGMPKNQDIGKMFDKRKGGSLIADEIMKYLKIHRKQKGVSVSQLDKDVFNGTTKYSRWYEERNDGRLPSEEDWFKLKKYLKFDNTYDELIKQAEREKIGEYKQFRSEDGSWATDKQGDMFKSGEKIIDITLPSSNLAKKWNGWKTAGLKPAHEPITIFQKPMEKNYCYNIEKHNCGAMNINACRVPVNPEVDDMLRETKRQKRITQTWEDGSGFKNENNNLTGVRPEGRFPANMIFDPSMGEILDNQSGISKSTGGSGDKSKGALGNSVYGKYKNEELSTNAGGLGDTGGVSRYFLKIDEEDFVPFLYCPKASKKEKGEGNTHVTVKPKALIKWLIKLVTPIDGKTIDITAGSGTHGLACEELNKDEGYSLKWVDVEMLNTEKEPYCEIAMNRIKNAI